MSRRDEVVRILNEFSWYCYDHCQDSEETADEIMLIFPEAEPIPEEINDGINDVVKNIDNAGSHV